MLLRVRAARLAYCLLVISGLPEFWADYTIRFQKSKSHTYQIFDLVVFSFGNTSYIFDGIDRGKVATG